jgi:cell division protein FtsZ
MEGYVNVDFEDVNTVMRESGVAIMGPASFEGENRARKAVQTALNSPLLEDNDIRGAQHILLNISSGRVEVTMDEVFEITEYVQAEAGYGTDLIWGNCFDDSLGEKLSVTIIATGFEQNMMKGNTTENQKIMVGIDEDMGIRATSKDEPEFEITNERTLDLEPVIMPKEAPVEKPKHTYTEPYMRTDDMEKRDEIRRTLKEKESQRMREDAEVPAVNVNPSRMQNSEWIAEMTKVPAFARRKIQLDDVTPSSEMKMSRLTVTDDDGDVVIKGNTYLYDKPC